MMTSATTDSRERKIWPRTLALVLLFAGLPLAVGGIYLITLSGSWYYAIAGIAFCYSALELWRRRMRGVYVLLAVFALTLIWSIAEVGFSFWPLVPRILAPIVLAAAGLFVVPFLPHQQRPASSKPFVLGGVALAVVFVGYIAAMFQPHDIISNDDKLTTGKISAVTLAAGNNWHAYGRTEQGSRFAPFDQINKNNINELKVAWTTRTGFIADQLDQQQDQNTPLYVDGTLYSCGPVGQIAALDGTTGSIRWKYDPKAKSTDWKRCRSLGYYDPADAADACGPRIIQTTVDARLIAVRASDGKPCESFGKGGTVSLWDGMGDAEFEWLTNSAGPAVAGGKIVVIGRVTDNMSNAEPSGVVRAYDARTGALAWAWDLGNPGNSGMPEEGKSYTRNTPNAWSLPAIDLELGLVYLPLGNAPPDYYGGQRRPFDDEYSSSVVALNLQTGKEVWRFQTVHHDLWDYDLPSQPVLTDIPDGKGGTIPGLIQTTKRAQVFVLDRRTGKPIKAVEERPVKGGDGTIKGEYYAKTQPFSIEMAAVGAKPLTESMMWGATLIDQMLCRIQFRTYNYTGDMTPPSTNHSIQFPGALGGMNFGSTAIDEEHNIMIAAEMRMPTVPKLIPRSEVTPDMVYTGESGPFAPQTGTPYARMFSMFLSPIGIPCMQPPWGTVSGIDLASGKQLWQYPAGTAKDLTVGSMQPGLSFFIGLPPMGGPMVTKGGIAWFAGTQDFYLRAFDTANGKLLWKGRLPLGSQANPMSYVGKDGRQYVVVSAGGARYNMAEFGDYIVAFALPKGK